MRQISTAGDGIDGGKQSALKSRGVKDKRFRDAARWLERVLEQPATTLRPMQDFLATDAVTAGGSCQSAALAAR